MKNELVINYKFIIVSEWVFMIKLLLSANDKSYSYGHYLVEESVFMMK